MHKQKKNAQNTKSYQADADEDDILPENMGTLAIKCPYTIEYIVTCSRTSKTDTICQILIDFNLFLEKIGDTKIQNSPSCSDKHKFKKCTDYQLRNYMVKSLKNNRRK